MNPTYKIHPAIGIARVGNSPTDFYLAPESIGALPIEVDPSGRIPLVNGQEQPIATFRDANNMVKRQAARFRVYIYDDQSPQGRPIMVGTQPHGDGGDKITGVGTRGRLIDIQWTVYLANKKASWYEWHELQGEHGYDPGAPLRNADIQGEDRLKLIIDPGPQTVSGTGARAEFAKGQNPFAAQNFPPPLQPFSIDTLGEIRTYDDHSLFVLGGLGNSGTSNTGFGQPATHDYANNDGWHDDVADGPVVATLVYWNEQDQTTSYVQATGAWVMVGYPRVVPQIPDIVTLDDLLYDLYVRKFNYAPYLYGEADPAAQIPPAGHGTRVQRRQPDPAGQPRACDDPIAPAKMFNPDYYPYWDTEIYPILSRPFLYGATVAILNTSDPHETGPGLGGYFDMSVISKPPVDGNDPYYANRKFVYDMLRQPGQENQFATELPAGPGMLPLELPMMPLLNGDNPLSNSVVSKFFRLTETQLFLLEQWKDGKFIAGNLPGGTVPIGPPPDGPGVALDRGVLANCLGGSFCPGAELTWIIRNCRLFEVTMRDGVITNGLYRIRHKLSIGPNATSESVGDTLGINYFQPNGLTLDDDIDAGLEPGDLTKRNAVPWQCDFNECTTNPTDITYDNWNVINLPASQRLTYGVVWWPAHRPLQVTTAADPANPSGGGPARDWAEPIPETDQGDTMMVSLWSQLGFLMNFGTYAVPNFVEVERVLPRQN